MVQLQSSAECCYLDAEAKGDRDACAGAEKKHLCRQSEIARLQRIEALLKQSDKELMKMALSEPVIKDVPALRVVSKREKGSYGETIGRLIGELCDTLFRPDNQKHLVKMSGPCMAIYHDQEYKEKDADIEVAIPITGRIEVDEGSGSQESSTCPVLALCTKEATTRLHLTYKELYDYMMKKRDGVCRAGRELYLNDPCKTAPEELLTEIQLPQKPRKNIKKQ